MKTQLDYKELDRTRPERLARIADALVRIVQRTRDEDVSHDEGRDDKHGC